MLLKSIKVKDFRQFKGEQYVAFSVDPDRNVTIIQGDNGSGKTSFAQAFRWCLYGDADFTDKVLLSKSVSDQMLPGDVLHIHTLPLVLLNKVFLCCLKH